ncbi:GIY-YIG nuclease family protein [Candidatus Uhrbacteria bacterium]|nr:GIY-YIG nuclease family protein [Candidatus Uhrbacteria bacterium]
MAKKTWFVYILRCKDKSLYTGITIDVTARIAVHNSGRGAAYTRGRVPVKLLWSERQKSESAARKLEAKIKKWKKSEKEAFIKSVI